MNQEKIKFSIITLVKNSIKYLPDYFKSILSQNYNNFEIIIVDNNSYDGSYEYIQKIKSKKIRLYKSSLNTIGALRNFAINKGSGDYFLTIDSDDKIADGLLLSLSKYLNKKKYDVIKYNAVVENNGKLSDNKSFCNEIFGEFVGINLLKKLCLDFINNDKIFGPSWLYAINLQFFKKNKLQYFNLLQEDFGMTPFLLLKADKVKSINLIGYTYNIRENSITTNLENISKKAWDVLKICDIFSKKILNCKYYDKHFKDIFKKYINKVLFNKTTKLSDNDKYEYITELKKRNYYE